MKKDIWQIVHDCDDDDGNPSCWAKEISHNKYGRFIWIEINENNEFIVTVNPNKDEWVILAVCKSLKSAKRWVTVNIG